MRRCVSAVAAYLVIALSAVPAASAQTPQYFSLPAGYTASTGIATAPDGTVWFVAGKSGDPSIGRLLPALAVPGTSDGVAAFPTPDVVGVGCCANTVRSVAFDGVNNRLWFVQSDGVIGHADPSQVAPGTSNGMSATLVRALQPNGQFVTVGELWDVAIGTGGTAWFTEYSSSNVLPYPGGRIASMTSGLGAPVERDNLALQNDRTTLDSQRYDAKPAGIATTADGVPWFAQASPGLPGYRVATTSGATGYAEYLITPCAPASPCSGSHTGTGITDVAVALDGSIWFTNQLKNEVGRLVPGGSITSYSLPGIDPGLAGGQARAITAAVDGTLWVVSYGGISNPNANAIVRIVPGDSPTATVHHLGAGRYPFAVAPDTTGNVWFTAGTDVAPGLIGKLAGVVGTAPPSGGGNTPPPPGGGTPLPPARVGVARVGTPRTDGDTLSLDQRCVGPPSDPCSLVYIISANEYVTGFPNTRPSAVTAAAAKKKKPVILGTKTVNLKGGQKKKVTVKLNAKGRKLLKSKGRVKLYFSVTQKRANGKPKRIKAMRVTFKKDRSS